MEAADPVSASGLARALQIIYAVADANPSGIGVSALSRHLGMPKAVAHRILKTLSNDGFLQFDEGTKRYSLGAGALSVGLNAFVNLDLRAAVHPFLRDLVEATGETATLSMRQGWARLYLDQVESPREVRMTVSVGRPYPLHAGSSSKAILAALPDRDVDAFLRLRPLESLTARTPVDPDALLVEISRIRRLGYAESAGERQPAAGGVASAVLRQDGTVFGSVSVCGPITRFDEATRAAYGPLVAQAAERVSTAMIRQSAPTLTAT
ncbi:IclR family transcriptional regulator [Streptosporangium sp. NPDC006007]|uniref:IclR family transcriptional regulator n=1 Tax=Streptosporangium sp. NPDC006007 TaxID=3154575 RepID=UPI0033BE8746